MKLTLKENININSLTPPLFSIEYAILIPTNPVPTSATFPFFMFIIPFFILKWFKN